MPFQLTADVEVTRDAAGVVRALDHLRQPYLAEATTERAAAALMPDLAARYLADVADIYGVHPPAEEPDDARRGPDTSQPDRLVREAVQPLPDGSGTVAYAQLHANVDVWEAGVAISMLASPLRVVASRSTWHHDIKLVNPGVLNRGDPTADIGELAAALGLDRERKHLKPTGFRWRIYQYDPLDPNAVGKEQPPPIGVTGPGPGLPVRPVPESVRPGNHFAVVEVLFAAVPTAGAPAAEINWRAFFEPETRAVLYLQAGSTGCTGQVYVQDPPTAGSSATPSSPAVTLDALRTTVTLEGLTASDPQQLSGQFVTVSARGTTAAPPTQPASSCDFSGSAYSVSSTNFAAVNCYYHLDELYRLMTTWGFSSITTLFPQTTFPVTAFYFDEGATVNAHANGNSGFTALTNYTFGSESSSATVGIAVDWRIVMHEFNHHILYDRVHSPNYGFAHNGGDAFAVVWFDPDSAATDRGLTFPWCSAIPRRHDRPVSSWAWGSSNDDRGYSSEQILSTSLMRIYTSAGGGAADANARRLASRHVAFLKVHADARLGPSPIVGSTDPRTYVTALQNADVANASPDGIPGGTLGKVFRWAFEKQGLFQPAGAPTPVTTPGAPPAVDVYIDDGRAGEYGYLGDFWDNTEVWNRLAPDGGTSHQTPVTRQLNYAYVRIRNRGTSTATGVVVRGYHARPTAGLTWPDDWTPMTTSQLSAADLAAGGTGVVGPFSWVPTEVGHECMLMEVSCPGDRSNIDVGGGLPCAFGPTPHWRLIPLDNNLAQRNVAPVAGGGGATGLLSSFRDAYFYASNPFDRSVRVTLDAELPSLLTERGWGLRYTSGAASFTLGPRAVRKVRFELTEGADFTPDEVRKAGEDLRIRIRMRVDGSVVGGMSYAIDPHLTRPPRTRPGKQRGRLDELAEELLEGLDLRHREVHSVDVTHVILDVELGGPERHHHHKHDKDDDD